MATDQRAIDRLLEADGAHADNSLRGKSLERARGDAVPKTLTPWEWQEWYARHGVPEAHRKGGEEAAPQRPWWRFWRRN
jgi:hypothetical protein